MPLSDAQLKISLRAKRRWFSTGANKSNAALGRAAASYAQEFNANYHYYHTAQTGPRRSSSNERRRARTFSAPLFNMSVARAKWLITKH